MKEDNEKNVKQLHNYYNVNQVYGEKYYQLPQVFFTSPKYKDMLLDAKVAYALLKDRFKFSVKNNWIDKDGNIFFIFTNAELMELLNCKKEKLAKIKKCLEKKGLIYQKRQGLNKPNLLYLLRPEVTPQDIYNLINSPSSIRPQGSSKIELPKNNFSDLQSQGSSKIELPKNSLSDLQSQGSSKIEHNQYQYYLEDTKKIHKDTSLDFNPNKYSPEELKKQNTDLIRHAGEYYTNTDYQDTFILNKKSMDVLAMWCKTPQELHRAVQIILNAKKSAVTELENAGMLNAKYILKINGNSQLSNNEKEALEKLGIDYNRLQCEITDTLRKVLNRIRRLYDYGKSVNTESYIFGAFKTSFKEYAKERQLEIDNLDY